MEEYYIIPKSDKELREMLLEVDSPGWKTFIAMGATSYIHKGLMGWLLGDIFYTAAPDSVNVLDIQGLTATFLITMPVSKITIPRGGEIVFYAEDEKATLYVSNLPAFHLDIGEVAESRESVKNYTPSPWK